MDVAADGRVLVSADVGGLVVATDLTTRAMLWCKQMESSVDTLRIHNNVVFVPVTFRPVCVLDVMTGDVLRRYPALNDGICGFSVIPGELKILYSSYNCSIVL